MTEAEVENTIPAATPFHVLAKPAGPDCNLDCEYCFYLEKSEMFPGSDLRMSREMLETHIKTYIGSQPAGCTEVNFAWQGGEPTLMGLDFFKHAIDLQKKYERPGLNVSNSLQTNGTLLDEHWCRFLKDNHFLVGISIDGPEKFHDRYRKAKGGRGSFALVKRGLDHLATAGVEFNVLSVVQRHNGDHPADVYRGLKELGAKFIQFIPIVEREGSSGVSKRSVLPGQFGDFLIGVFDVWRAGDMTQISVRHFDTALNIVVGRPSSMCVHAPRCGRAVAVEHNGDVFSCDHFVFDDHRIGNIRHDTYAQMMDGPVQTTFGEDKEKTLTPKCKTCAEQYLCNGGCPAHRFLPVKNSSASQNYLCEGYSKFFRHIEPAMIAIKETLDRQLPVSDYFRFLPNTKLKPHRNDSCPCGSGNKFKLCCGT